MRFHRVISSEAEKECVSFPSPLGHKGEETLQQIIVSSPKFALIFGGEGRNQKKPPFRHKHNHTHAHS